MRERRRSRYSVRSPSKSATGLPSSSPARGLSQGGICELERRLVKQSSIPRSLTSTAAAVESYPDEIVANAPMGARRSELV